jgi:diacylglycerol O-acyltransferase 2, plant
MPALLAGLAYAALALHSRSAGAALAALAVIPLLPPPPRWRGFEQSRLFDAWRRRHALRVILPSTPPVTDARTLFAHFPHGVFPMGCLLTMALSSDEARTGVPVEMAGCVASVLLRIPGVGAFFSWIGCHPADKGTLMRLLRRGSVGLIPEGIAGVHLAAREARAGEAVYLKKRTGFIRAAIQAGVPVVPTYHFGTRAVFDLVAPPGAAALSRAIRAAIMVPVGVWGWLPIPRAAPITVAVGPPLRWPQQADPSPEVVAAAHAEFVDALVKLFDEHKHLGGPGMAGQQLKIV